jgi:hypothetical protein
MNKTKIIFMLTSFMLAVAVAATTQAAPPGTEECPQAYRRVHVSGPQGSESRDADDNGDGWVCERQSGGGVPFIDNHIPDND